MNDCVVARSKRSMSNPVARRAVAHCISLPPDVSEWAVEEARICGMPLSAWIGRELYNRMRAGGIGDIRIRLERIETRMGIEP